MSEEVCYSTVDFSKSPSAGTSVKQEEVTYEVIKTTRSPSAQTTPPPGPPVKQDERTTEDVKTAGSPPAQTAPPPEAPVKVRPSRPPPYRLPAVCLGLLCAVLLIALIALTVYCIGKTQNISQLKDELDHLRVNYSNLTAVCDRLQVNFSNLTAAHDKLLVDFRNLTTNNTNLSVSNVKLQEERKNLTSVITKLRKHFPVDRYCSVSNQSTLEEECRPCPWGWELFSTKCYYFSTDNLSWNDSRTACRKLGADLVVINSSSEQEFISNRTQGLQYWMGMTDVVVEGTWIWVDGTQPTVRYWNGVEPNNCQNEDCLATTLDVKVVINWNDKKCELPLLWICEGSSLPLPP
ncbi:CD209 antigen-like protein B [Lepisosteus oculatus]|uniref:CD209 antigen-like protein B n=1 Tax=Lepisosteus oculatus TaxID=7918 RepID=UPI0037172AA1